MKCPNCGMDNPDDKKFCGECGSKLETTTTRKCVNCGRGLPFDAMICQYCGYDYRQKLGGGADRNISKLLSYGLIIIGVWMLAVFAANYLDMYWRTTIFLDLGIGVVVLILGLRSLGPKQQ